LFLRKFKTIESEHGSKAGYAGNKTEIQTMHETTNANVLILFITSSWLKWRPFQARQLIMKLSLNLIRGKGSF